MACNNLLMHQRKKPTFVFAIASYCMIPPFYLFCAKRGPFTPEGHMQLKQMCTRLGKHVLPSCSYICCYRDHDSIPKHHGWTPNDRLSSTLLQQQPSHGATAPSALHTARRFLVPSCFQNHFGSINAPMVPSPPCPWGSTTWYDLWALPMHWMACNALPWLSILEGTSPRVCTLGNQYPLSHPSCARDAILGHSMLHTLRCTAWVDSIKLKISTLRNPIPSVHVSSPLYPFILVRIVVRCNSHSHNCRMYWCEKPSCSCQVHLVYSRYSDTPQPNNIAMEQPCTIV